MFPFGNSTQDISPNSLSNTSSSSKVIPLIVVFLVVLALGAAGGYWWSSRNAAPKIQTDASFVPATLAEEMIAGPQKEWGSLVQDAYAEFRVQGSVTKIEQGQGSTANGTGDGWYFTLRDGVFEHRFFVGADSDWMEGKINEFPTWKTILPTAIQVGDNISIQTHAPIRRESTPDSFFGWWVFRYL